MIWYKVTKKGVSAKPIIKYNLRAVFLHWTDDSNTLRTKKEKIVDTYHSWFQDRTVAENYYQSLIKEKPVK